MLKMKWCRHYAEPTTTFSDLSTQVAVAVLVLALLLFGAALCGSRPPDSHDLATPVSSEGWWLAWAGQVDLHWWLLGHPGAVAPVALANPPAKLPEFSAEPAVVSAAPREACLLAEEDVEQEVLCPGAVSDAPCRSPPGRNPSSWPSWARCSGTCYTLIVAHRIRLNFANGGRKGGPGRQSEVGQ